MKIKNILISIMTVASLAACELEEVQIMPTLEETTGFQTNEVYETECYVYPIIDHVLVSNGQIGSPMLFSSIKTSVSVDENDNTSLKLYQSLSIGEDLNPEIIASFPFTGKYGTDLTGIIEEFTEVAETLTCNESGIYQILENTVEVFSVNLDSASMVILDDSSVINANVYDISGDSVIEQFNSVISFIFPNEFEAATTTELEIAKTVNDELLIVANLDDTRYTSFKNVFIKVK